jgi:hypothetical protein
MRHFTFAATGIVFAALLWSVTVTAEVQMCKSGPGGANWIPCQSNAQAAAPAPKGQTQNTQAAAPARKGKKQARH